MDLSVFKVQGLGNLSQARFINNPRREASESPPRKREVLANGKIRPPLKPEHMPKKVQEPVPEAVEPTVEEKTEPEVPEEQANPPSSPIEVPAKAAKIRVRKTKSRGRPAQPMEEKMEKTLKAMQKSNSQEEKNKRRINHIIKKALPKAEERILALKQELEHLQNGGTATIQAPIQTPDQDQPESDQEEERD